MASKQCPKCRLYNPSEAMRCDCGYDFASGTVRQSYVLADSIQKHGAEGALARVGQTDVRFGMSLMILAVIAAVALTVVFAAMGERGVAVPLLPFLYGAFRFARGMTARNRAKQALAEAQRAHSNH
jgi:hypothetical protein